MRNRNLEFLNLNEVLERLDLLMEGGYGRSGNWTLGQNCNHLATVMEFSQWVGRTWIGTFTEWIGFPLFVMHFARLVGWIGLRVPTLPFARQKEPVDDAVGVERLTRAVREQQCRIGAKSCTRFQLWHCGHHLGFLTPRAEPSSTEHNASAQTVSAAG